MTGGFLIFFKFGRPVKFGPSVSSNGQEYYSLEVLVSFGKKDVGETGDINELISSLIELLG